MADHPSSSIPAACRRLAETMAAYRFLDDEKSCSKKCFSPIRTRLLRECKAVPWCC
ncbi:hypothetical protein GIB64_05600 [Pseudomonas lactis]|uniref:Transposase Tn5-like N-terminal domain-containing protein n=1 Tax=Pseudomonas fluorescens TaxID=294 RepID=A0A2T0ICE2_PSEFL|nr:hypothetical protein [Pseudomonas lactis]MBC6624811.1 hypothetical protein [Pseudomonas sp.]MBH3466675.1 hypothetical protein [Pseudomonas carnis]MBJ2227109.1 hypothetical protein [Pseudomonas sp. MF7451]MCF5043777.1 hypothetical protein [Pseudomonas sp. PA-7-1E]MCF5132447.1 hypothetical protein [Pseudomonas sp. PA-6-4F]PRW73694.1 hypothetical protein C7A12_21300 [Pseudomonas fluorescens]